MPLGTGEAGTCGSGSGRTMCSPVQTDSNPAASAACATRTAVTGSLHGPMLMANRPNFITRASLRQRREVRAYDLPVAAAPGVHVGAASVRGRRRAAALRAHGERVVPVEDAGVLAEGAVRPLVIDERRLVGPSHGRLQEREEARLVVEAVRGMIEHLEVVVERGDERARVTLVEGGDELLGERADIVQCGHVSLLSSRGMALWRSKARAAATVAGSPRRRLELTGKETRDWDAELGNRADVLGTGTVRTRLRAAAVVAGPRVFAGHEGCKGPSRCCASPTSWT